MGKCSTRRVETDVPSEVHTTSVTPSPRSSNTLFLSLLSLLSPPPHSSHPHHTPLTTNDKCLTPASNIIMTITTITSNREEEGEEDSTPLCLHNTPSLPKAADSVNTVRHKKAVDWSLNSIGDLYRSSLPLLT
ncbi:hypothetical protein Hamer_G030861 [Homarus americanus]|uniref:Uncharacterized protein n=1 Tax=Homarus americanus TaxID=6706 RepID=A0A8J5N5I9_HOMAM|nr:hypothetical protein Hamer_G030861 [Homarus americanus]